MSDWNTIPKQDAYQTELAASINSSTTTITVADAPDFTLGGGESVYAVIDPKNSAREGIQITAISGTTLTVTRGLPAYSGGASTAASHSGGATIIISDNWQTFDDIEDAINSKLDNKTKDNFSIILNKGSLASRIISKIGKDINRQSIIETYRELSHCLKLNSMLT